MRWFLKLIIFPLLDALEPRVIVEVGVEVGAVTGPLLDWAREHDALVHCIDPDPNLNVEELAGEHGEQLRFHRKKSLDVLAEIAAVDVALIDGDHNWHTVLNELRALERRAVEDGCEPPLVLLHDTGWPYGRRDLYYDPQGIPAAHRQPHARMGIVPGQSELGVGLNDHLENAVLEGTPANGVLTAVEDFVAASEIDWNSFSIPGLSGLTILYTEALRERDPAMRAALARLDAPEVLRAQCEAVESARIQSELKRAGLVRRLAETQLKQVMQRVDPERLVELHRRVRELEQSRRELEEQLQEGEEARAQLRLLTARAGPVSGEPENSPRSSSVASERERDARRVFLERFLPVLEQALPDAQGRDPLALPSPLEPRGRLIGSDERLRVDPQATGEPSVDVVVCVHDALEDVRLCLWSLTHKTSRRMRLIVVDDGSGSETREYLDAFAAQRPAVTLIRRDEPRHGYTLAANAGLKESSADYVVLLNSDVVLSGGWLERILARGESDARAGILGPLSNAASHQSVPELRESGSWATNPPPDWLTVEGAAFALRQGTPSVNASLPFLNGFCYTIKRAVIDAIGYLDEERFAEGYCEENDYSQRARDAGFELAVVDDAYVFHSKSRSYGAEGRRELARHNYEVFRAKHGAERIDGAVAAMEADATLAPVRVAFAERTSSPKELAALLSGRERRPLSIAFILPGLPFGGSGGSHSVYQEVKGLRELGVSAHIALPRWDWERAKGAYADAAEVFQTFGDHDELAAVTADADVISATHYKSVAMLKALRERREDFLPAYYVQDYEPFFTAPQIAEEAVASYTAVPEMLLFAKSHWLCNVVADRHGLPVAKVEPSIDSDLFRPRESRRSDGPLRVAAMVRPRTERRQPHSTIALLERLLEERGDAVEVATFGCYVDELREIAPEARALADRHRGLLARESVAQLLGHIDVFLDMSIYQAFGRTALEAMACGCAVVVPTIGGVWEFLENESNGLAVDTLSPDEVFDTLVSLSEDGERLERLRQGARKTASRYSIARAALSEYLTFEQAHRALFGDAALAVASSLA